MKRLLFAVCLAALVSPVLRAQTLTSEDRDKALKYLEKTRAGVIDATKGLSDAQWQFKAATNRWSMAEVLEHIAAAEDLIRGSIEQQVLKAPARTDAEDVKALDEFILQNVPNRTRKVEASEPLRPTNRFGSPKDTVKHFEESRAKTILLLKDTKDLREHATDSPLGKKLDGYQWILFIAAHSDRHTKQMLEVKADPNFPEKMTAHQNGKINTVAIIGAGPVASTLATLLMRRGVRVAILYRPRRAPLVVGESLVPAIIPMLRMLGVEEQVRDFSMFKPGATFNMSDDVNFSFFFSQLSGGMPPYAYNVPRDRFDEALLEVARKAGVKVFEIAVNVERVEGSDRVRLDQPTLEATGDFFQGQPDLIVDATGRVRLLPNLLQIPSREGGRKDTALFAHVDHTTLNHAGHVHTTRIDHGWSWRIPLPGRVSLGMVVGAEHLPKFGATKEERYDNLLQQDSVLRKVAGGAKRVTPVVEYTNYQLVTSRVVGDGWVLVGDTAGFIDPVFSSGLYIGMHSAMVLADAIQQGTPAAFRHYEEDVIHHLTTWHELVSYYYDGRLFTCFRVGQMLRDTLLIKLTFPHINKHMGRIFSGAASTSPYSLALLRFAMKYGMKNENPRDLMIR